MMGVDWPTIFGVLATCIAVLGYIPYFAGIIKGTTKPHFFTWLLGGIVSLIAFTVQLNTHGGAGAWVAGFSTFASFTIAYCGLKHFNAHVRPVDWYCLVAALVAIPLWLVTHNPTYATFLITAIVYIALFPTIRKSWLAPDTEVASAYLFQRANMAYRLQPCHTSIGPIVFIRQCWYYRTSVSLPC